MASNMVMTRARMSISVLTLVALLVWVGQALSQHSREAAKNQDSAQLITVLRDEQLRKREPELVAKAIERLGDIKSVEAIDDLVHLLTFIRNIQPERVGDVIVGEHFITTFGRYPAAGALFRIGKASLPALIEVVETEQADSLAGENAIYTVTQIFRDAPLEGVEYLRDAAAKASSTQAAQRLSDAAKKMKRLLQQ